jgi:outer membrane biosynthesis protein TonB
MFLHSRLYHATWNAELRTIKLAIFLRATTAAERKNAESILIEDDPADVGLSSGAQNTEVKKEEGVVAAKPSPPVPHPVPAADGALPVAPVDGALDPPATPAASGSKEVKNEKPKTEEKSAKRKEKEKKAKEKEEKKEKKKAAGGGGGSGCGCV